MKTSGVSSRGEFKMIGGVEFVEVTATGGGVEFVEAGKEMGILHATRNKAAVMKEDILSKSPREVLFFVVTILSTSLFGVSRWMLEVGPDGVEPSTKRL
jgi:hypothetical protein